MSNTIDNLLKRLDRHAIEQLRAEVARLAVENERLASENDRLQHLLEMRDADAEFWQELFTETTGQDPSCPNPAVGITQTGQLVRLPAEGIQ